jgi:hypothetical protein
MSSNHDFAKHHAVLTSSNPTPAANALVEILIGMGAHRCDTNDAAFSASSLDRILSTWDPSQVAYLNQRAREYGQSVEWIADQFPADILRNPHAVVDALDKAGELQGMQIEHIISQANAPALANDANNIILAPADGFNQSLGSSNMTSHQVAERSAATADYIETVRDTHEIPSADLFTFQDSWDAFNALTYGPLRALFAFQHVDKDVWKRTIRLGQRIVNEMPRVSDRATRHRMLDAVVEHLDFCAGRADIHTAFLTFLLITNVPWAATLLAAKGIASLAKLVINGAKHIVDFLESRPSLRWAAAIIRTAGRPIAFIVNLFDSILTNTWQLIQAATEKVGDILAVAYSATAKVITSIWQGLCSLADFFSPKRNAYA